MNKRYWIHFAFDFFFVIENNHQFIIQVYKVTSLGKAISGYPVLPRYGKMLALSHQHNLFEYMICIVAALSVQEVKILKIKSSFLCIFFQSYNFILYSGFNR